MYEVRMGRRKGQAWSFALLFLVGEQEICKVTDFGMARDVNQENIYETKTKVPATRSLCAYEFLKSFASSTLISVFTSVFFSIFYDFEEPTPR